MKALTVWQPHASLIAHGVKHVETRSWRTPHRGPLAIHAAARRPQHGHEVGRYRIEGMDGSFVAIDTDNDAAFPMPLGAVVAVCRLIDCVPIGSTGAEDAGQEPYGDFRPGRWAWLLGDVRSLRRPVPALGKQLLWNWERD